MQGRWPPNAVCSAEPTLSPLSTDLPIVLTYIIPTCVRSYTHPVHSDEPPLPPMQPACLCCGSHGPSWDAFPLASAEALQNPPVVVLEVTERLPSLQWALDGSHSCIYCSLVFSLPSDSKLLNYRDSFLFPMKKNILSILWVPDKYVWAFEALNFLFIEKHCMKIKILKWEELIAPLSWHTLISIYSALSVWIHTSLCSWYIFLRSDFPTMEWL